MKNVKYLILLFSAASVVSCQNRQAGSDYSSYKRITLSSKIENVQPMTGIVFWSSPPDELSDVISLEYSYMHYNDVVKSEDVYDWTAVDSLQRTT